MENIHGYFLEATGVHIMASFAWQPQHHKVAAVREFWHKDTE